MLGDCMLEKGNAVEQMDNDYMDKWSLQTPFLLLLPIAQIEDKKESSGWLL